MIVQEVARLVAGIRELFMKNERSFLIRGQMTTKEDGTLVGEADQQMRVILTSGLKSLCDIMVVSEEGECQTWPPTQGDFWVIDEFDGSNNHNMGLPLIGSMVTSVQDSAPFLSCIYSPYLPKRFYWASRDGSSGLHVKQDITELHQATLLLEGSSRKLFRDERIRRLTQAVARSRIDLSMVWSITRIATGRAELLVCLENKVTDNLHAILFTQVAGGIVTDFEGNAPSLGNLGNLVCAANLEIHAVALQVLRGV
ncbi:MAG: inositol monophosphatase family protein [Candidatus Liptonbacteria bacterium]